MIQTVWVTIRSNGYSYSPLQIEVHKCDNSGVLKFLMDFKKEGACMDYFIANYNTTVN